MNLICRDQSTINFMQVISFGFVWDMNHFSADVSSVVIEQLKLQNMNKLDLEYIVARSDF